MAAKNEEGDKDAIMHDGKDKGVSSKPLGAGNADGMADEDTTLGLVHKLPRQLKHQLEVGDQHAKPLFEHIEAMLQTEQTTYEEALARRNQAQAAADQAAKEADDKLAVSVSEAKNVAAASKGDGAAGAKKVQDALAAAAAKSVETNHFNKRGGRQGCRRGQTKTHAFAILNTYGTFRGLRWPLRGDLV